MPIRTPTPYRFAATTSLPLPLFVMKLASGFILSFDKMGKSTSGNDTLTMPVTMSGQSDKPRNFRCFWGILIIVERRGFSEAFGYSIDCGTMKLKINDQLEPFETLNLRANCDERKFKIGGCCLYVQVLQRFWWNCKRKKRSLWGECRSGIMVQRAQAGCRCVPESEGQLVIFGALSVQVLESELLYHKSCLWITAVETSIWCRKAECCAGITFPFGINFPVFGSWNLISCIPYQ